jgi:bacterial/archaeal transporter family protein
MIQWYIYALGSAIFHTLFEIMRKKALLQTHAMNFESLRTFFVACFCIFLIPFLNFNFHKDSLFLVYIVSLIATIGILFSAKAFKHGNISLISPLSNIRPLFVTLLATLFLSESLMFTQVAGILMILIATYLLESDHHVSNFIEPIKHLIKSKYSIFFLFATFLFSICAIFDKFILTNKITNIYTYFFFLWLFMAINFNIVHTFNYGLKDSIDCFKKCKYLAIFVALFSLTSNLLAYQSLSLANVSLVTPVLMISTLFIVLFGGKFFHEKYLFFRIFISIIMLIGAYLVIM